MPVSAGSLQRCVLVSMNGMLVFTNFMMIYDFFQTGFPDSPSGTAPEEAGTVVPLFVLSFAECLLPPAGFFAPGCFGKIEEEVSLFF